MSSEGQHSVSFVVGVGVFLLDAVVGVVGIPEKRPIIGKGPILVKPDGDKKILSFGSVGSGWSGKDPKCQKGCCWGVPLDVCLKSMIDVLENKQSRISKAFSLWTSYPGFDSMRFDSRLQK